jgi:hypothetical protein
MNTIHRFATRLPTICAVCRRHAMWVGYAEPPHRGPVIWLCDDNGCHAAAQRIYAMPDSTLDAYEIGAALEAAAGAGAYLEEIGQTDLAKLRVDQWREFLQRLYTGFEQVMRRKILNDEPPF